MARQYRSVQDYSNILRDYNRGFITEKEFQKNYNRLRDLVNKRMAVLERESLDSSALDAAKAFNFIQNRSDIFGARTKQKDYKITYEKMLQFASSPFSTPKEYLKALRVEQDLLDFFMNSKKSKHKASYYEGKDYSLIIQFILRGDYAELLKIVGNSPKIMNDLEELSTAGVTYEDFKREFDKFKAGQIESYEELLNRVRK